MLYFEKSQPAPACLVVEKQKANGDYKCGGVLERLRDDFKNKCYICEKQSPASINVEHLKSHQGDKALKFSWDNLFWSCSHCNNTKLANFDNIWNCTKQEERVEERLGYFFHPFPFEKVSITALDSEPKTIKTQELVESVFNGTTKLKTIEGANIREELLKEIEHFQKYLIAYFSASYDEDHKSYCLIEIKKHLNQASNFTSFKRWIIRGNERMWEEFGEYC